MLVLGLLGGSGDLVQRSVTPMNVIVNLLIPINVHFVLIHTPPLDRSISVLAEPQNNKAKNGALNTYFE